MKITITLLAAAFSICRSMPATAQSCTITCPANIIVMADSSKEGAIVNFPKATTTGECGTITYSPAAGSFFRIGSHSVTATTSAGPKCAFTVTVTDNESPQLSPITLSRKMLWPASNKMKRVGVYYTASDNAEEVNSELTVTSNDTSSSTKDWEILNGHMVRLKASRLPDGSPRVYTITVKSTDAAGNITRRATTIAVSNTMVAKTSGTN
jgi:hypothetical protein